MRLRCIHVAIAAVVGVGLVAPAVADRQAGPSAGAGGGAAAKPAKPAPAPGTPSDWLDLRKAKAKPIWAADGQDVMPADEHGALSVWIEAGWNDKFCAREQRRLGADQVVRMYIFSHGTAQRAGYRVAVTCDRSRLLLEHDDPNAGYKFDELQLPGDGLRDGRPHQLSLRMTATGTELWVDGQLAGTSFVSPRLYSRAPVAIGGLSSGAFKFTGRIARLRLFDTAIAGARLDALGKLDDAQLQQEREADNLVVRIETGRKPRLVLQPAAWDPARIAGGRAWMHEGQEGETQDRFDKSSSDDLTYQPFEMNTVWWASSCGGLPRAAEVARTKLEAAAPGGTAGCRDVLVMATITSTRDRQQRSYRVFERTSPEAFKDVVTGETLTRLAPVPCLEGATCPRLRLGATTLTLSEAKSKAEDYGGSWVGGGLENMDVASRGFHVLKLDPFDVSNTGTSGFIFGMNAAYMHQYRPHEWRKDGGLTMPWGLFVNQTVIGCKGGREVETIGDEQSLAASAANNFGWTAFNYTENERFQQRTRNLMSTKRTQIHAESRCTNFILVLDPARAVLSNSFRTAVEATADPCAQPEAPACVRALDALIASHGTHYANGVAYGGVIEMTASLSEVEIRALRTMEREQGKSFAMELQVSGTYGVSTGALPGASTSVTLGTSFRFGFESSEMTGAESEQVSQHMFEQARWESRGGRGGSTFEGWSSDPGSAVPIYADLRPITELLSPRFFSDPRIYEQAHDALERRLAVVAKTGTPGRVAFSNQAPFKARNKELAYDTELVGATPLESRTLKTPEECFERCKRNQSCHAFNWATPNVCTLLSGNANAQPRSGYVSKKVRTPPAPVKVDDCGVPNGDNACKRCAAQVHEWGNDYIFLYGTTPAAQLGAKKDFANVCRGKGHGLRCYRVCLRDVKFECQPAGPGGGRWVQVSGSIDRDAWCKDSGDPRDVDVRETRK